MAEHDSRHTTDGTTNNGSSVPWPERLRELARLAPDSTDTEYERDDMARSINFYLDAIESILCDPRAEITTEVERCRPNSGRLRRRSDSGDSRLIGSRRKGIGSTEHQEPPAGVAEQFRDGAIEDGTQEREVLSELGVLSKEVTALQLQFMERRKESNQICDLYEERCRGFKREMAELELEVDELKADLVEDAVELEGITGTIHGLQAWIDNLHAEQVMNRRARSFAQQKARRRWINRASYTEDMQDTEIELVLEGLRAWMRGWNDVEQEFQIRASARRTRREQREAVSFRA